MTKRKQKPQDQLKTPRHVPENEPREFSYDENQRKMAAIVLAMLNIAMLGIGFGVGYVFF